MKQCPACKGSFKQLKKGGCPICGEPLFYYKGQPKRTSDKDLAIEIRRYVCRAIERNQKVGGYLLLNEEQVYAYRTIDTLRAWLDSQTPRLLTTRELVFKVLDAFLVDPYWSKNLKTLRGVHSQCVRMAMTVYRNIKIQAAKEQVQAQRIDNANINTLTVDYTV